MKNVIFWNVDTQNDFMNADGKLSIQDAEKIKPVLKKLTEYAKKKNITVINTGDWHTGNDEEISLNPDFKTTFPEHCIAQSDGAMFIDETMPENPVYVYNEPVEKYFMKEYKNYRNIVIYKNKFDVFTGNPNTENILKIFEPDLVVVYGVATNVCVNQAVLGLINAGYDVQIVKDAIMHLPNMDYMSVVNNWISNGVTITLSDNIIK